MRNHFSTCVRKGDFLFGFDERMLTCLEWRTGKVRWKERGFDKGSLILADDHLIVLGEKGKLALVEASPDKCRVKASCQLLGDKCWSAPALADGRLYIRDEEQAICLDVRRK
ncbi:MAG: hypothetical protein KatS3mg105_4210 [Gemmatales bacterium]|nr:MAG: hypothetical protein KatS3mg105_4210 [Gemmatales bacterium]